MIDFPHAKINLGLFVTEKRKDAYHNIETVLFPVKLNDILEIVESEKDCTSFFSGGINIPEDNKHNLCMKAFEVLRKDYNIPSVNIHLYKNIPIGAGLGGGSADAAFTLKLLNEIFSLKISKNKLMEYAAILGSDCAFFIQDKPMLAKGRGEILFDIDVSLKDYYLMLIKPPIHLNTAKAYSLIKPKLPEKSLKEIISNPPDTWKYSLINDFEIPVFKQYPYIKSIKDFLYDNGAIYASMSGSGSAVFGIFKNKPDYLCNDSFKDCFCRIERIEY